MHQTGCWRTRGPRLGDIIVVVTEESVGPWTTPPERLVRVESVLNLRWICRIVAGYLRQITRWTPEDSTDIWKGHGQVMERSVVTSVRPVVVHLGFQMVSLRSLRRQSSGSSVVPAVARKAFAPRLNRPKRPKRPDLAAQLAAFDVSRIAGKASERHFSQSPSTCAPTLQCWQRGKLLVWRSQSPKAPKATCDCEELWRERHDETWWDM